MRTGQVKIYRRGKLVDTFGAQPMKDARDDLEYAIREELKTERVKSFEQFVPTKKPVVVHVRVGKTTIKLVESGNY